MPLFTGTTSFISRGRLTNAEIRQILGYSRSRVLALMGSLRAEGLVELHGRGRAAHYVPAADRHFRHVDGIAWTRSEGG